MPAALCAHGAHGVAHGTPHSLPPPPLARFCTSFGLCCFSVCLCFSRQLLENTERALGVYLVDSCADHNEITSSLCGGWRAAAELTVTRSGIAPRRKVVKCVNLLYSVGRGVGMNARATLFATTKHRSKLNYANTKHAPSPLTEKHVCNLCAVQHTAHVLCCVVLFARHFRARVFNGAQ